MCRALEELNRYIIDTGSTVFRMSYSLGYGILHWELGP
jgi:hypothetical protein